MYKGISPGACNSYNQYTKQPKDFKYTRTCTANTRNYNISGLSDMLKLNPEFRSLCAQLYLKYGSFASISPEYKMMFLVFTSAYIVRNKNLHKNEINQFLDQPIEQNLYNNIN